MKKGDNAFGATRRPPLGRVSISSIGFFGPRVKRNPAEWRIKWPKASGAICGQLARRHAPDRQGDPAQPGAVYCLPRGEFGWSFVSNFSGAIRQPTSYRITE